MNRGAIKSAAIAIAFDDLMDQLLKLTAEPSKHYLGGATGPTPGAREMAIVRTKLEEACFFAQKSMSRKPENQERE